METEESPSIAEMAGVESKLQQEYNHYILVATSLGAGIPVSRVLEIYRMRWQITLAFKRLK